MAWDTERTRELLLDAAVAEFSERGLAGARVDRISERAGVNRERLYSYFGDKRGLFEAALSRELSSGLTQIEISGSGPDAVAEFAGRLFDSCAAHPNLSRLVFWEGLENGGAVDRSARQARSSEKAAELRRALPGLSLQDASQLLLTIVSLCYSWAATPNLVEVVLSPDARSGRRDAVSAAVRALSERLCR